MAITVIDGFDLYHTTNLPLSTAWALIESGQTLTTGRFGGQAMRLASSGAGLSRAIAATDTLTVGYAIKIETFSSGDVTLLQFRGLSGELFTFQLFPNGTIRAIRGGQFGTLLGTSSAISTGVWHYLEFEFTRNSSTGSLTITMDGTNILAVTGQNTGGESVNEVRIKGAANSSNTDYDDVYITDTAAKLGECRVETLVPSADTGDKDWTASTGSDNYAVVDELPSNADTDYVSSATPGDVDLYALTDLSASPVSIKAVKATVVARKDDVTTREVRTKLKSGGTTSDGATRGVGTSYAPYSDIYEVDPDTTSAWTPTNVNALQAGMEVVT